MSTFCSIIFATFTAPWFIDNGSLISCFQDWNYEPAAAVEPYEEDTDQACERELILGVCPEETDLDLRFLIVEEPDE